MDREKLSCQWSAAVIAARYAAQRFFRLELEAAVDPAHLARAVEALRRALANEADLLRQLEAEPTA